MLLGPTLDAPDAFAEAKGIGSDSCQAVPGGRYGVRAATRQWQRKCPSHTAERIRLPTRNSSNRAIIRRGLSALIWARAFSVRHMIIACVIAFSSARATSWLARMSGAVLARFPAVSCRRNNRDMCFAAGRMTRVAGSRVTGRPSSALLAAASSFGVIEIVPHRQGARDRRCIEFRSTTMISVGDTL